MIIYWSMALWIGFMALLHNNRKSMLDEPKLSVFSACITFAYIIFWVGMRTHFADTTAYISRFRSLPADLSLIPDLFKSDLKAPGFDAFSIFFKVFISTNFQWWLMTIAIISGFCLMLPFYRKSVDYFYTCLLFVLSTGFIWMMNGMRQFIVISVVFACYSLIEKGKLFRFLIVVFVLYYFHSSVIIMVPIYFLARGRSFSWETLLLGLGLLFSLFFTSQFTSILDGFLEYTPYAGATDQFIDDGIHPLRGMVAMVPVIIAFINRNKIKELNDPFINICINMSCITCCMFLLGTVTSGILFGRIPGYTEMYNFILIPFLFKHCFSEGMRRNMYIACGLGYTGYFYLLMRGTYYVSQMTGIIK